MNDVWHPLTGEVIRDDDIDAVLLQIQETQGQISQLQAYAKYLRTLIGAKTVGTAQRRKVLGKRLGARVIYYPSLFDQDGLKGLWNSSPQHRQHFLKIETIAPKRKAINEIRDAAIADGHLRAFCKALLKLEQPNPATPRVEIYEIPQEEEGLDDERVC